MFIRSFSFVAVLLLCAGGANTRADAGRTSDEGAITHVLNRLSYGPRPGEVERVRTLGLERWIETQLSPSRIDNGPLDRRLQRLQTLALDSQTLQREYSAPARAERRQKQPDNGNADPQTPAIRAPAGEAQRKNRQVIADLEEAKAAARGLQRAPTRRSAGRFLVQSFQRLRRKRRDA